MKIAINGCGIGGPTLAWWLRKYGFEPVLFEKAPALRSGGHLIDFWGNGYDVAEKMGLLPALKQEAYMMERVRSVTSKGVTTSSMNVGHFAELTNNRYMSIARSDLSRQIMQSCQGIETRFGTSIVAIKDQDANVQLELSDGSREVFDLVIGADGLHSPVRDMVFGPESSFELHAGFYVAAFTASGYAQRDDLTYLSHTIPNRQISRVSLRDDKTLFLLIFSKKFVSEEPNDERAQRALLQEVFGNMGWESEAILGELEQAKELYFDRVSQIRMPEWTKGRVALLGDAAACASLLAGEGTGLAMTEAYVLAGELNRASGDHAAAFPAYQKRLHTKLAEKQDSALKTAAFFAPKNWVSLVMRDVLTNMTAFPFFGKQLLKGTLLNNISLPSYELEKHINEKTE